MTIDLFRLVYCSRNTIDRAAGPDAEIGQILAASRAANALAEVTGALLHSDGCFAQALEGPRAAVHATFERIQRDPRHADVVVLQTGRTDRRLFGAWSMALAAITAPSTTDFSLGQALVRQDNITGADVLALLNTLVVEDAASAVTAA